MLRAKYFLHGKPLKASPSPTQSSIWSIIVAALPLDMRGFIWSIGDRSKVHVFYDRWILNLARHSLDPPNGSTMDPILKVKDLIEPGSKSWNNTSINSLFL